MGNSLQRLLTFAADTSAPRRFTELIDLSGSDVGDLDLDGMIFEAPVRARATRFLGRFSLGNATFLADVDFTGAVFARDVRMERTIFAARSMFTGAEVRGIAALDECRFRGPALLDQMTCLANLSLARTRFEAMVSFAQTECLGGLWADGSVFARAPVTTGLEVHGRSWWRGALSDGAPIETG